jgi:hypothetical protein
MRPADDGGMNDEPEAPTISNLNAGVPMDSRASRRMAITLYALLLPLVIAGFAVQAAVDIPPALAVSASLSEVMNGDLVEIRDSGGAVVLSGEFRSRVDSLGNTEKDAELTDQNRRTVIGEVELDIPAAGREHRRPELEVDIIHLQPRQRYTVVIDDRAVGTFLTDDRGSVDMELQEGEIVPGQQR